jgi:hypothetical protein
LDKAQVSLTADNPPRNKLQRRHLWKGFGGEAFPDELALGGSRWLRVEGEVQREREGTSEHRRKRVRHEIEDIHEIRQL